MNKRKLLTLALTLCMIAILAIGGTLAYFTDTDVNKNVMTVGNVQIVQNEQQRVIGTEDDSNSHEVAQVTGDGLETFENGKKMFPMNQADLADYTSTIATMYENGTNAKNAVSYKNQPVFDGNAIDKIITVSNVGTEECYHRTLLAFEVVYDDNEIDVTEKYLMLVNDGTLSWIHDAADEPAIFTIDNVDYRVAVYTSETALPAGYTSAPSMKQFYLKSTAGNEFYAYVGNEYNILALSQAVQTEGFENATAALNAAFGNPHSIDEDTMEDWFTGVASAL